jgi:predicted amidohydrolase YtcJ
MSQTLHAILERIADRAGQTPKGEWVFGSYLNEQTLAEKAMPTRTELDRAVPDHPVFLMHATVHMCALNTRAFRSSIRRLT